MEMNEPPSSMNHCDQLSMMAQNLSNFAHAASGFPVLMLAADLHCLHHHHFIDNKVRDVIVEEKEQECMWI